MYYESVCATSNATLGSEVAFIQRMYGKYAKGKVLQIFSSFLSSDSKTSTERVHVVTEMRPVTQKQKEIVNPGNGTSQNENGLS